MGPASDYGLNDQDIRQEPSVLDAIRHETDDLGFKMASEPRTGSFLRSLAASKPGGRFLELGTGTGVGTAWLLDGMDESSRLVSVDNDPEPSAVARRHLGDDPRVRFELADGAVFLERLTTERFDLIYADA